jgi:hypothetical protein
LRPSARTREACGNRVAEPDSRRRFDDDSLHSPHFENLHGLLTMRTATEIPADDEHVARLHNGIAAGSNCALLEHFSPASALGVLRDARFQRAPQHEVSC